MSVELEACYRPRDGTLVEKAPRPRPKKPGRESYRDVRLACHLWLMKRDPSYRETVMAREEDKFASGQEEKVPGDQ